GVVIGTDGFGYRPSSDGRGIAKIPHLGNVVVENDVEIGANTCVDRGKFGATRIGVGTQIDNLCRSPTTSRSGAAWSSAARPASPAAPAWATARASAAPAASPTTL
ncbi:MAG: hypothetical protein ACKO0W_02090, partial [Planctomycetota bacterium]